MHETGDIERLYRRYGPMVLRRCQSLVRDEQAAFDLMQEVFVKVLEQRKRLDLEHPSSLFWQIATRLSLNWLRDHRREQPGEEGLLERIAHEGDLEQAVLAGGVLDKLFGREQADTRSLAVMFWIDGFTLEEVARESGLSVSGVRKRLRLLRERLHLLEEVPC